MATIELYYRSSTDGSWIKRASFELEEFMAKYHLGMWAGERDIVRRLQVGDSYNGGGGAVAEWLVTRTE